MRGRRYVFRKIRAGCEDAVIGNVRMEPISYGQLNGVTRLADKLLKFDMFLLYLLWRGLFLGS